MMNIDIVFHEVGILETLLSSGTVKRIDRILVYKKKLNFLKSIIQINIQSIKIYKLKRRIK